MKHLDESIEDIATKLLSFSEEYTIVVMEEEDLRFATIDEIHTKEFRDHLERLKRKVNHVPHDVE